MKVKITLFASARDLVGGNHIELELPKASTVADLKQELVRRYPEVNELLTRSAISVDHEFALDTTTVNQHSEVALIPPVSGG